MKDWKVGEIVGFMSATAFALTIVYLYGYSIPSHLDLFEYLSVDDYFRLAVAWLVPVALMWGLSVLMHAALLRPSIGRRKRKYRE